MAQLCGDTITTTPGPLGTAPTPKESSWIDLLNPFATAGGSFLNALGYGNKQDTPTAQPTNWLLIGGVAAGAVVVVAVIMKKKGSRSRRRK